MTLLSREEIGAIRARSIQLLENSNRYGPIHPECVRESVADMMRLLDGFPALLRAILAANRLDQYAVVFEIGELADRLEGNGGG